MGNEVLLYIYRVFAEDLVGEFDIGDPPAAAAESPTGDDGVSPSPFADDSLEKMYDMAGVNPLIPPPAAPACDPLDAVPSKINASLPRNVLDKVTQWLCDTGCGQDLVGKGVLSARWREFIEDAPPPKFLDSKWRMVSRTARKL